MALVQLKRALPHQSHLCAEETLGLQEWKNNAAETQKLQEGSNKTGETSGLQGKSNSAVETQGLQEAKSPSRNQEAKSPSRNAELQSQIAELLGQHLGGRVVSVSHGPGSGHPPVADSRCAAPMVNGHVSSSSYLCSESKPYKVCELFSPQRASTLPCIGVSFTSPPSFDLQTGWDFFDAGDRAAFWRCLREQEPDLVLMSPECRPFSILMNSNWNKMDPQEVLRIRTRGMAMFQFCIQVAAYQLQRGRHFWIEQPALASSLATHASQWLMSQFGVFLVQFDQCAAGLSVLSGLLSKKPTCCITNHLGIIRELSKLVCSGDHPHVPLQGGLPAKAQEYPVGLVSALLDGIRWWLRRSNSWSLFNGVEEDAFENEQALGGDGEDLEEEADLSRRQLSAPQTPSPVKARAMSISPRQRDLVNKLHVSMGHLPRDQMLAMLKAAGARDEVRQYVKEEYKCLQCSKQHGPVPHKHAPFPRTFSFNKLIGIDYFYISFMGKTHAFLNAVCQGTNLQQVALLPNYSGGPPNARDTWALFNRLWVSPFGLPEVVLCDQGSEFKGDFERSLEQAGVMQSVTDSAAPWQNGRVERHGAWLKQRLEEEVQSGQAVLQSSADLEMLAIMVTSHKNRWFHRGEYSPYQLVFGVNPRVPLELLSDDQLVIPGIADADADSFEADTPAAEFARAHAIRQRARQLCMNSNLKDKVRLSLSHQSHQRRQWAQGQWVYVWRKLPGTGGGHMTRSRWVGPGVVIMQSGHSVWVAMRSRIWKCSSDQLRAANHLEALGAELTSLPSLADILQQTKAKQAGAVDVESEGAPSAEAWEKPLVPAHESVPSNPPLTNQPLESIPEDPSGQDQEAEQGQRTAIRDFLPPALEAPPTPLPPPPRQRQVSVITADEPQVEPIPSDASSRESKGRRPVAAAGEVRKRVSELESQQLEREALRELRRLDREERQQRRMSTSSTASTPRPLEELARSSSEHQPPEVPPDTSEQDGHETLGDDLCSFFSLKLSEDGGNFLAGPPKAKSAEFDMKKASKEERLGFEASDKDEWETILRLKAVKVLSVVESEKVKKTNPERVISSSMIRRKKPTPGVGSFKFKSRWCLHGHQDPDSGTFEVYSPMPSTEAINMFFQLCLNMGLKVSFLDIKNAFCQADKLKRPQGKIYAVPCEGLGLSSDQLIEIVAPIYGLDDSPLRWHRTLLTFFEGLGFERSLIEPCWLIKRVSGKVISQVLVEVDDLNIACTEEFLPVLQKALLERFEFGKWEQDTADFAGRHVSVRDNKVIMHQEKYILEKLFPVHLKKGRLSDRSSPLDSEEFESFRSMLYKVNWVGHQTRPEACGVISILASRLKNATVHDVACLNKLISHLRSTASQPLVLHKFDNNKMTLIAASDAGGVDSPPPGHQQNVSLDNVQGAWLILAAERVPSASSKTKVSILSWRSSKLKRRVSSTLASEALAFSQALGELEWLQIMFRDVVFGDVNKHDWSSSILPFVGILREDGELYKRLHPETERLEQCSITDAKSLFDSLKKENPSSRQDRRTAIEIAIIIESMQKSKSILRWSPHPRMVADVLTKDDVAKSNGALEEMFRTGSLSIWDEADELARRKSDPKTKARSKKAAGEFRQTGFCLLVEGQPNSKLGVLFNLSSKDSDCVDLPPQP